MSFWAYMLHCRGGYFYTGHTDNLERRIAEHQSGMVKGFAADHMPIELVWSQEFSTRIEALEAERRIKGWSRAKKLALIRDDWPEVSRLAKGKNSPSTSSGRTGRMAIFRLLAHPDTPSASVSTVTAQLSLGAPNEIWVEFMVAPIDQVALPEFKPGKRANKLWRSTCFEVFLKPTNGQQYFEFNLSPSQEWAAYAFDRYRSGMRDHSVKFDPEIEVASDIGQSFYWLATDLPLPEAPGLSFSVGLSAVIEEKDGSKSYWALSHPEGPPDFHHDDCFLARLP